MYLLLLDDIFPPDESFSQEVWSLPFQRYYERFDCKMSLVVPIVWRGGIWSRQGKLNGWQLYDPNVW